jgi:hypothetical protein
MSKNSAKKAGRTAKSARAGTKKTAKSSRARSKKTAKSARGGAVTAVRASRRVAISKDSGKMLRTSSPPMQPGAPEAILRSHKYTVGEVVYYTSPSFGRAAASGSYTVVKLLPSEGDDYQYRIKSSVEAFERVAKESQLDRA